MQWKGVFHTFKSLQVLIMLKQLNEIQESFFSCLLFTLHKKKVDIPQRTVLKLKSDGKAKAKTLLYKQLLC